MLAYLKIQTNFWSLCFCAFGIKKHINTKNTLVLCCNSIAEKERQKKIGQCVFVFFVKKHKNTKTHRLSGAVLLLKKRQKKIWSLCFCVFHKKKHKNTKTQKHIGPLVQFYCWKKHNQKFFPCVFVFFVKKHKNTKTHWLSGLILLLKKTQPKIWSLCFCVFC